MCRYLLQQRPPTALPEPSISKSSGFLQNLLFVYSILDATKIGDRHLGKHLRVKLPVQFKGGRNVYVCH